MSKFQIWILAVRPKTLWAAVAPVVIGSAMAYESAVFALLPALMALLGAIAIQIGTNLANDYYDFKKGADSGERLGPMRVTQAGLVSPKAVKNTAILAFSIASVAGVYLVYLAGWPIVIIGVVSIVFGVLYTAGPYSLADLGLGEIFVLIFFGPVAVAGTYYVQAMTITNETIIAGLGPGLFSVAILAVNNLRDIDSDRIAGRKTLAVRLGLRFARYEYLIAVIVASSVPIRPYTLRPEHPWLFLTLIVSLIAIPSIRKVFTSRDGEVLNKVLADTGKLLLLYSVLFAVGWIL